MALGFLPISLVLLAAGTFIASYVIAVARGDVFPAFPYISDTGALNPESCIFGQFLNIAAFLSLITMCIRYKAVEALCSTEERKILCVNKVALFFGSFSSLGCSMVANFQEGTIVEPVHITGALLVFGFGVVYTILQTYMSYLMYPDYNGLYICRIRLALVYVSLIGFIVTFVTGGISRYEWDKANMKKTKFNWDSDDPGYAAHVASTVGEWVTALTFLFYFFTFAREFHKFQLRVQVQPMVRHLDEEPYLFEPRPIVATERTTLLASQAFVA